ncbi:metal-dependent transcriptional regulator [Macrococcus brunensis]|uniref:metal-dependent transcriptional regulator n=1 Tax=Macrococcus brunensis TaxID=198483 RepID=UPI001EF0749B|nr:metal-dependent transcriptional regulator [Macrococcus brunensis]ULG71487.1 metal-dependent transcriptional regulator [Macrococcus brunensis]
MAVNKISEEKEDYLKVLLSKGGDSGYVSNKLLANQLQVKPPSVTEMMTKLQKDGLVDYQSYKGYMLTDEGLQYTLDIIKRHRLIESFLIEFLNYSWDQVHSEAEVLEHKVSSLFIDRIDELMGYPAHCPHGGIIPRAGDHQETYQKNLLSFSEGDFLIIRRTDDHPELLSFLDSNHININSKIQVVEHDESTSHLLIRHEDNVIKVDKNWASGMYGEVII